jgi:hypothetical protein
LKRRLDASFEVAQSGGVLLNDCLRSSERAGDALLLRLQFFDV